MFDKVLIKVKDPICIPLYSNNGDWYDLKIAHDISLEPGVYRELDLGVAMELPTGYEAIITARSSTFKRFGILQANGISVIDNNYNGDDDWWRYPIYATRKTEIAKGERICQFRVIRNQPYFPYQQVERLKNKNRGGLGSTNK